MDIQRFWKAVLKQNKEELRTFFHQDAYINWHNTNEHFTVDEFIQANCEYPGQWDGTLERIHNIDDSIITVMHVFSCDHTLSFHVTSFLKLKDNMIVSIDEYWGDDGLAPQWRLDKHIGVSIHKKINKNG